MSNSPSDCWVVPFGNPRINGYLHLPEAYRSLSRPSSPPWAKASAMRPFLLSLWYSPSPQHCCIGWAKPLILSAVLIVKFFTCVFLRFGNSLKLNFKSYFLQFVLCQYVKDLLHLPSTMYNVQFSLAMRRGDSGIEPELQPFLLYMLNRFAYKKHWV